MIGRYNLISIYKLPWPFSEQSFVQIVSSVSRAEKKQIWEVSWDSEKPQNKANAHASSFHTLWNVQLLLNRVFSPPFFKKKAKHGLWLKRRFFPWRKSLLFLLFFFFSPQLLFFCPLEQLFLKYLLIVVFKHMKNCCNSLDYMFFFILKSHQNGNRGLREKENHAWWKVLRSGLGLYSSLHIPARNRFCEIFFELSVLLHTPPVMLDSTNDGSSNHEVQIHQTAQNGSKGVE